MSDGEKTKRTQELVERSQVLRNDGQLQDAASTLQEADALAPNDATLNVASQELSIAEAVTADISLLCAAYITSKDEKFGQRAVSAASQTDFSVESAAAAISSLLACKDLNVSTKRLILRAIASRINGAKSLANMVYDRPAEIFVALWDSGDLCIEELVRILIKPEVWRSGDDQVKAVRDLFPLFLAKLSDPDCKHHETAMRSIAKLNATHADIGATLIDHENLTIILSFLNVERPSTLKSQATLTIAKFLESSPDRGQEMLKNFVTSRFGQNSNDDIVAAISVAGASFPLVPGFGAHLFLTPGFTDDLVRIARQSQSSRLRQATLELLSSACIDKDCRAEIYKVCRPWLEEVLHAGVGTNDAAMAGLILSKLRQEFHGAGKSDASRDSLNELVPMFKGMLAKPGEMGIQTPIEGLAYNSIDSKVKEQLANDPAFLKNLVNILSEPSNRGPALFGGLTILSNITAYAPKLSEEEKRVAQLKAYANQTRLPEVSSLDNEKYVAKRCRKVLDAGVAAAISGATTSLNASPVILNLVSHILLSISNERQHCGIMAQQGLFDPILRLAHLDQEDSGGILPHVRRQSAQALARILISVDPKLLFTRPDRTVQKCIGPLNFLLSHLEPSDPKCAFDALRALTNISLVSEKDAKLLSDSCFASIAVYLQSPRSALQQAATECICNLSWSEHFLPSYYVLGPGEKEPYEPDFDIEDPSANRKEVQFLQLIRLTSSKARGTRLSAMGALVAAMGIESGRQMLIRAPDGLEYVLAALTEAQTQESGEALGLTGESAYVGDADMRIRAACVIKEVCCETEDMEVHRRLVRHGLMKLMGEGAKHLPSDSEVREHLLSFTDPMMQRLREVFENRLSDTGRAGAVLLAL